MTIKKRLKRKILVKKDVNEVLPLPKKFLSFFKKNLKFFLISLSIIITIFSIITLWFSYRHIQEKRALSLLSEAFKYYLKAIENVSFNDYKIAVDKFLEVLKKFPNSNVSKNSFIYLANSFYWINDFTNSEKYFLLFLDRAKIKDQYLKIQTFFSLGYISEKKGDLDKAIMYYNNISNNCSIEYFKVSALINLARVYEQKKQYPKVIEICREIIKNYPTSKYATIAKNKIYNLEKIKTN